MVQYELRFLDLKDKAVIVRAYWASDDLRALSEAERQSVTHTIEVWEGNRRVARVKKGNIAATPIDRLAG
jgi:hypothetical protein